MLFMFILMYYCSCKGMYFLANMQEKAFFFRITLDFYHFLGFLFARNQKKYYLCTAFSASRPRFV